MSVQMVATSLLALLMATGMMTKGLPPIAYTIPGRLAVLTAGPGLGGHPGSGSAGLETMAGLLP